MESAAQIGVMLLMVLFGLGAVGCAIAIPICAAKFLAVLYEHDEEGSGVTGYALMPLYRSVEPAATPSHAAQDTVQPSRPRARGAAAGK